MSAVLGHASTFMPRLMALAASAMLFAACSTGSSGSAGPDSDESASPSTTTQASASSEPTERNESPTPVVRLETNTVEVLDAPAAEPVRYDTATVTGLTNPAASAAQAAVDEVTTFDAQAWRDVDPSVCEFGGPPCGDWEQTVQTPACLTGYLCVIVKGTGVFPGTASSSSVFRTLALDVATGETASIEQVLGDDASVETLVAFVTEDIAFRQRSDWGIDCSNPSHVVADPLTKEDLMSWLPTAKGLRMWLPKYRVAPGNVGDVSALVPWNRISNSSDYIGLGQTNCEPTALDEDGLPVQEVGGVPTLAGYICGVDSADRPDIVQGTRNVKYTRVLQYLLNEFGFYDGPYDGLYGSATRRAVREAQYANGLATDGKVGPLTWDYLQGSHCRNWG